MMSQIKNSNYKNKIGRRADDRIADDFDIILKFQHEDFLENFSAIRTLDKMEDFKDK